jgi:hypothetical protein
LEEGTKGSGAAHAHRGRGRRTPRRGSADIISEVLVFRVKLLEEGTAKGSRAAHAHCGHRSGFLKGDKNEQFEGSVEEIENVRFGWPGVPC